MGALKELYGRMIGAMGVEGLEIPVTAIKFFKKEDSIPTEVGKNHPSLSLTSCQATKQASLGDAVLLTVDNIGCIAAAITFGLVDQNQAEPMGGPRVYTDIMKGQSGQGEGFKPPSPKDFTEGTVYACKSAGRPEFALFGKDDVGRFKDVETAKKAMADMMAIQPPTMKGVFFYSKDFNANGLVPDVVVLSVRSVEMTRIIQGYQFNTGKRVKASMGGLRAVNSDLIVRPYLTQEMNIAPYCLGARLLAEYQPDRMGMGMPFPVFQEVVAGMEASKGGFPFHLYPGAGDA